jgi:hypothetical protein
MEGQAAERASQQDEAAPIRLYRGVARHGGQQFLDLGAAIADTGRPPGAERHRLDVPGGNQIFGGSL